MKKILILLAAICCCGCVRVETKATRTNEMTKIKYYRNDAIGRIFTVEIEGHTYIAIVEGGGAGIIHAEHCPCKKK